MPVSAPKERNIQEQLVLLTELQKLDNEIIEFEEAREMIPEHLGELETPLLGKRNTFEEIESQMHIIEGEHDEKKRTLDLERIKLKNTRNKEMAVQNIKQYEAFVKEIETQELTSEDIEADIKKLNTRFEELKIEREILKTEIEELDKEQVVKRDEMERKKIEIDKALEKMYDRRDDLSDDLDEEIYLKYEYIAERKDGIAVAEVEHGHCSSCNMAIPPQMLNELIRADRLMGCPACSRILVYVERSEA